MAAQQGVPWTFEESMQLLALVKSHKANAKARCSRFNWKSVVAELSTERSPEEARHRYARLSRGDRDVRNGADFYQTCQRCGKKRRGHLCRGPSGLQPQLQQQPQPQPQPSSDDVHPLSWSWDDIESLLTF